MSSKTDNYYATDLASSPRGGGKLSRADLNKQTLHEMIQALDPVALVNYTKILMQSIDDSRYNSVGSKISETVEGLMLNTNKHRLDINETMIDANGTVHGANPEGRDLAYIKVLKELAELRESLRKRRVLDNVPKAVFCLANILNKRNQNGASGFEILKQAGFISEYEDRLITDTMDGPIPLMHGALMMAGLVDMQEAALKVVAKKYLDSTLMVEARDIQQKFIPEIAENIIDIINNSPDKATAETRVINEFINSDLLPENYDLTRQARAGRLAEIERYTNMLVPGYKDIIANNKAAGTNQWGSAPSNNMLDNNGPMAGTSMIFDPTPNGQGVRKIVHDYDSYAINQNQRTVNNLTSPAPASPAPGVAPNPTMPMRHEVPNVAAKLGLVPNPNEGKVPSFIANSAPVSKPVNNVLAGPVHTPTVHNDANVQPLYDDTDMAAAFYDAKKRGRMLGTEVSYTPDEFPYEASHYEYEITTGRKITVRHRQDLGSNGMIRWRIPNVYTTAFNPAVNRMKKDARGRVAPEDFDYNYRPVLEADKTVELTDGRIMVLTGNGWGVINPNDSIRNSDSTYPGYKPHAAYSDKTHLYNSSGQAKGQKLQRADVFNPVQTPAMGIYNLPGAPANTGYQPAQPNPMSQVYDFDNNGHKFRFYEDNIYYSFTAQQFVDNNGNVYDYNSTYDYLVSKGLMKNPNSPQNTGYNQGYQNTGGDYLSAYDNVSGARRRQAHDQYSYGQPQTQSFSSESLGSASINARDWVVVDVYEDAQGRSVQVLRNKRTGEEMVNRGPVQNNTANDASKWLVY